ncbi:Crp/Fnr family transcriptional regulator [Dactylosporangium sp. NPDC051541]|uniref:Crp/Fnr family transcriptional regulator n=1 Tax=Dactylosporangium sp. NPDC051541 TaxID=3363977 RepID=UPI00378A0E65
MSPYAALDTALRQWAPIPDAELARAHRIFRPHRVPARTLLQRAGEPSDRVSFIVRGLARIYLVAGGGTERVRAFRAEGDLVCAYAAALRRAPSAEFIETLEECELLTAARPAFAALCGGHPAWTAMLNAMQERLFLDAERRSRDLLGADAAARYRSFLTERPALAARLTQRQIAAYVGITPEALSRLRHTPALMDIKAGPRDGF